MPCPCPQVFGGPSTWNWLGQLGSSLAVLVLDTRSERTREMVLSTDSWSQ